MDHLQQAYDLQIDPIPCLDLDRCISAQGTVPYHGFEYSDFIHFPLAHGFDLDKEYKLVEVPSNIHCTLSSQGPFEPQRQRRFLQAWLYFSLVRCVVRSDRPLLDNLELKEPNSLRLSTRHLREALQRWHEYLRQLYTENRNRARLKFTEASEMLNLARRVVIANLAEETNTISRASQLENSSGVRPGVTNTDDVDRQALCLMVLGETLSAALAHTREVCGIQIRGWKLDEDGWGPPAYVSKKMKKEQWCKRFQEVLKDQLGRNATLLYVTLQQEILLQGNKDYIGPGHRTHFTACTPQRCHYVQACHNKNPPSAKRTDYSPLPHPDCQGHGPHPTCWMVGPSEEDIMRVLDPLEGKPPKFPLLRIHGKNENARVEVEEWVENTEFATISHVWSQGMGNRLTPKIWYCQLQNIQKLLDSVFGKPCPEEDGSHPFWLDTLAMPAVRTKNGRRDERRRRLRNAAVGMIYQVFDKATHGVIIDRHLLSESSVSDCRTIGIKLLSGAWIKRLWTLQEAYVTRNISIAVSGSKVRNFETLWADDDEKDVLRSSMTMMVRRKLFQNLMGYERLSRKQSKSTEGLTEQSKARWSLLISSAWYSARYREAGRPEQETYALATLLNVKIPDMDISEDLRELPENDAKRVYKRQDLMRRFWQSVDDDRQLKGSIPAGMIFLPGKRLSLPGFGWAPETWMSSKDESYPYPLTSPSRPTRLHKDGLVVRFPGFLIRCEKEECAKILGKDRSTNLSFTFPVSSGLYDWYMAKSADDYVEDGDRLIVQDLVPRVDNANVPRLAIILSRPRPAEFPGEVGLLVEITKTETSWEFRDGRHTAPSFPEEAHNTLHYCRIIRRLIVSRVSHYHDVKTQPDNTTSVLHVYRQFGEGRILGESVEEDQHWCVDGYLPPKHDHTSVLPRQQSNTSQVRDVMQYVTAPISRITGRETRASRQTNEAATQAMGQETRHSEQPAQQRTTFEPGRTSTIQESWQKLRHTTSDIFKKK